MAMTRRTFVTASAATLLASTLPAFGDEALVLSGRAYGTSWRVRLRGRGDGRALADTLAALLARVDLAVSPFRADSEISRFNRAAAGWHGAGADFARVTAEALRIAALTGGAFDPGVGPDVGRYGFGPITGERAGSHADFKADGGGIAKADARQTLDLCGIAKGYALDLMAESIAAAGFADFVAELGGEVLARGRDSGGAPWRIGISHPLGGLYAVIDAGGLAVATSGDAINAYEVGGRRYSHVIDPQTDEPLRNGVASVTVLAGSAMTADALATALMVMGPERGIAFAEAQALPVLYLLRGADGLSELTNGRYDSLRLS